MTDTTTRRIIGYETEAHDTYDADWYWVDDDDDLVARLVADWTGADWFAEATDAARESVADTGTGFAYIYVATVALPADFDDDTDWVHDHETSRTVLAGTAPS